MKFVLLALRENRHIADAEYDDFLALSGLSPEELDMRVLDRPDSELGDFSDVDGVFTADPRIVPTAHKLDEVSSEEMLELAANGAKILHLRSVEYARRFGLKLHVRSSFSTLEGTWVIPSPTDADSRDLTKEIPLEQPLISGVAHDRSQAKVTIVGVPDVPGYAAKIFGSLNDAEVNLDMIVQNVSTKSAKRTDISVTLPQDQGDTALQVLRRVQEEVGFEDVQYDDRIGKLSLVGAGMKSNPGVSFQFFKALSNAGVNIDMISTSEIRISVITRLDLLDDAVRAQGIVVAPERVQVARGERQHGGAGGREVGDHAQPFQRAMRGEFNAWAKQTGPAPPTPSAARAPPPEPPRNVVPPAVARQHIERLRDLLRKS